MTDAARLQTFIDVLWDEAVTPALVDYIRIPNKSPAFDPDWAAHGHMDRATALLEAWARERMANFKVPRYVRFVDRLPRNASLKVLKHELRAQFRS